MSHIEYTPCQKDFGRHLIIKKQQPSLIREKRKPNRKEKRKPNHETELMSNSQLVLMTLRNKTKIEREKGQKEKPTKKLGGFLKQNHSIGKDWASSSLLSQIHHILELFAKSSYVWALV